MCVEFWIQRVAAALAWKCQTSSDTPEQGRKTLSDHTSTRYDEYNCLKMC